MMKQGEKMKIPNWYTERANYLDLSLVQLQKYYDENLNKTKYNNPKAEVVLNATLITTTLTEQEHLMFSMECWEVLRKIKSLFQAKKLLSESETFLKTSLLK